MRNWLLFWGRGDVSLWWWERSGEGDEGGEKRGDEDKEGAGDGEGEGERNREEEKGRCLMGGRPEGGSKKTKHTKYTAEKARSPAWTDSKLPAWGTPGVSLSHAVLSLALTPNLHEQKGKVKRRGMRKEYWDAFFWAKLVG